MDGIKESRMAAGVREMDTLNRIFADGKAAVVIPNGIS